MILTPFEELLPEGDTSEIELDLIDDFPGHPFQVRMDEDMERLMESIRDSGVLVPVILRRKENDRYETIAGHRRCYACRQLQMRTITAVIKEVTDEEAVVWMVDSNIQRTDILPSEKAKAYRMKMDALSRQGKRNGLDGSCTSRQTVGKWKHETAEQIGGESGDSGRQVQRFLRLNALTPELLAWVDERKIPLLAGVELSYLKEGHQEALGQYLKEHPGKLSQKQARELRTLSEQEDFSNEQMSRLLLGNGEKKARKQDEYGAYFPEGYSEKEKHATIIQLLMKWKERGYQL